MENGKWKQQILQHLWIQRKPGGGKSVLAKSIQNRFSNSDNSSMVSISAQIIVGGWYYSVRESLRAHSMMLRSLLFQVLEQDRSLFRYIQNILDGESWSGRNFRARPYRRFLQVLVLQSGIIIRFVALWMLLTNLTSWIERRCCVSSSDLWSHRLGSSSFV